MDVKAIPGLDGVEAGEEAVIVTSPAPEGTAAGAV
jgi:hypothetical protein